MYNFIHNHIYSIATTTCDITVFKASQSASFIVMNALMTMNIFSVLNSAHKGLSCEVLHKCFVGMCVCLLLSWTLKLPQDYLLCKQTAVARDTAMQAHSDWITTYIIRLPRRRPWGGRGRVRQHMHIHSHKPIRMHVCMFALQKSGKSRIFADWLNCSQGQTMCGM